MVLDNTLSGWPEIAIYTNGLSQTTTPNGVIPVQGGVLPTTANTFRINRDTEDSTYQTNVHDLVLLWCGRALQPAEVASLSGNPWQIFAPTSPYWMAKSIFPSWLYTNDDQ